MKYGFVFPKSNVYKAIEYAIEAENSGWDAFFVWESLYGVDAWITLTAIACKTEKIRLGTLITPLSRMKPWKVASELLTLDLVSQGRVTLSVALGAIDTGFADIEDVTLSTDIEGSKLLNDDKIINISSVGAGLSWNLGWTSLNFDFAKVTDFDRFYGHTIFQFWIGREF